VPPHLPQLEAPTAPGSDGAAATSDLVSFAPPCREWRFVSEFGLDTASFVRWWPAIDWDGIEAQYGLQRSLMDRHVPADQHTSFDSWRTATQRYQASLLRHQIETLRRMIYRPSGGFCLSSFADAA
jgi:beta-mannosidase